MNAEAQMSMSLLGLSVGDAFGEQFFGDPTRVFPHLLERRIPDGPWRWTDDTEMAVVLSRHLERFGEVDQQQLALEFAEGMTVGRGYGRGAYEILTSILEGVSWHAASRRAFRGQGSFGNGAAMRVAPLGAYFASQGLQVVVEQARRSAEITHAHEEGVAGAVAIAVASALASASSASLPLGAAWLREVHDLVPGKFTRETIAEALTLEGAETIEAAKTLGNGSGVSAPDTVPFCLWVCAFKATDFETALWETVSALGDRDTTCAIVGGIVGNLHPPPESWQTSREPYPERVASPPAGHR